MRHNQWLTSTSLSLLLVAGASNFAFAPAQQSDPNLQSFDPRRDEDARPRDLLALQDDLYLLDGSLAAFPHRNPRFEDFQSRAADIRVEVTALADRISADPRHADRRGEERYGADYRFVPARLSEITALRDRIGRLREEIDNTNGRRWNSDIVLPAGTEIEVMLDSGLSSRWASPGDRFEASTTYALPQNGRGVIPAGTVVTGSVREVRSHERGQQDGWLRLDFDTLTPQGGPDIAMQSHVVSVSETRSSDKRVRNGALGALLGGVIGCMIDGQKGALIGAAVGAGGGLVATKGQEVDVPEGTLMVLRLDRPITVSRRDLAANRRY